MHSRAGAGAAVPAEDQRQLRRGVVAGGNHGGVAALAAVDGDGSGAHACRLGDAASGRAGRRTAADVAHAGVAAAAGAAALNRTVRAAVVRAGDRAAVLAQPRAERRVAFSLAGPRRRTARRQQATERSPENAHAFLTPRRRLRSLAAFAQLEQVVPGVDAGGVAVAPLDLDGVAADRLHPARAHALCDLAFAHHPPAAPFLDALGARAARAEPPGRELRLLAVVPAHEEIAVVVEGEIAGLGLRRVRLELVEESHGSQ